MYELEDPTRVDLVLDPTKARMTGTTVHGVMPFDVPVISDVSHNLWMGGCATGLVLPPAVQHVISLYPWEQYEMHPGVLSTLGVKMYDSIDDYIDIEQVEAIARWVNVCRMQAPTLVYCQAGLNRSALICGVAMCLHYSIPGYEAVDMLREARSPAVLCNPLFERFVLSY